MLTANTDFERRFGGTAFFHAHAYELPYTFLVENFERIGFEDTFFFVNLLEFTGIITRIAERHLSQVVRAE